MNNPTNQRTVAEISYPRDGSQMHPSQTLQMQMQPQQTQQVLPSMQPSTLPAIEQPPQENYITAYGMVPFAATGNRSQQRQLQQPQNQFVAPTFPPYIPANGTSG